MTHHSVDEPLEQLSSLDLSIGLGVLSDLLSAGLPLARALQAFEDLAPDRWRPAIPAVRSAVREGKGLAAALAESRLSFTPLTIGIIRAGEAGSGLAPAVAMAARYADDESRTRDAIRAAIAYPLVVGAAGLGTVGVMIGWVLPRFETILLDLDQQLPPITTFVLRLSSFAKIAAIPVVIGVIAGALALRRWTEKPHGRLIWQRWLLDLPAVGQLRLAAGTARLTAALAALLGSGVPLRNAMGPAAAATGDAAMEWRALRARDSIVAGSGIARALREERVVTSLAARLAAAGEQSGHLAEMLTYAARLEAARVERLIRSAVRLIEPAMIMTFALVVGTVAMALLQAVYAVRPR